MKRVFERMCVAFTLVSPMLPLALAADGPRVVGLTKAVDGDQVIFAVELERPADMATMSIEHGGGFYRPPWPRVAELQGSPAWRYACYLEYVQPANWWEGVGEQNPLTFVGRGPQADAVELRLHYPRAEGAWQESVVRLELATAPPMKAEPAPQRRWAAARIGWFGLLAEHSEDPGGFYAFAGQQTRRQFGLAGTAQEEEKEEERMQSRPTYRPRRNPEEELYNITTGALAVQESLQLDRTRAPDRDRGQRSVATKDIPGVAVKSHPFDELRGDKSPVHSDLAKLTPADFYYLRFGSIAKLLELLDFCDQWGASLLRLAAAEGTDYGVRERVHRQLCLPASLLARTLGPAIIKDVALVGSDPYVQEGADISVLFRVAQKPAFTAAVGLYFQQAQQQFPDAVLDTIEYSGVTIERLRDPQRQVSCHRCWLDDVCVYSNSLAAIQRIIDARGGTANLAAAPDFQYMRAVVFPLDPQREDGFLYLSDAFIRRLVGPEVRIAEKRRLEAITSLKLLENAALLYGYEHGPGRPTLEQLAAAGVLRKEDLYDPEGGEFTWDAERGLAHSDVWGDLRFLTPLIELKTDRATEKERDQYKAFRERYQQYWRQYFDPIGVRMKVDRTIRIETCILPLIDVSEYDRFQDVAGGEPIEIRTESFTPGTLLRFVMHLNDGATKREILAFLNATTHTNAASDWLGDWATFWIEDSESLSALVKSAYAEPDVEPGHPPPSQGVLDVFNSVLVAGAQVKNKLSLAAFLVALRTFIDTSAPNTVVFNNLPAYNGVTIVQIAPDPAGELGRELRGGGAPDKGKESPATQPATMTESAPMTRPAERGPALYYAAIGDGFYLSTQASALRAIVDRRAAASQPATQSAGAASRPAGPPQWANLFLYAAPGAAEAAKPALGYVLEQQARSAAIRNMAQIRLLGRCGVLADRKLEEAARHYLGYGLTDPDGGVYVYDAEKDEATSSLHGPLSQPARLPALPATSPLARLLNSLKTVSGGLRFTKEGVSTTVEIERR